jgi:hypothetical protein
MWEVKSGGKELKLSIRRRPAQISGFKTYIREETNTQPEFNQKMSQFLTLNFF